MKTLIYSSYNFDKPFLSAAAKGNHELSFTSKSLNIETAELAAGHDAIALFSGDDASPEVLDKLSKLGVKFIALRSVGFNHVDLERAKNLEFKVANVPEYSPFAIAEHAVALLLMLNRKLLQSQRLMSKQDFRLDSLVGFDLNGKTIGVIGTGKIGMVFSKIMLGFGCKILAFDIVPDPSVSLTNFEYTSLENLLQKSDVVSLHCPLNSSSQSLLKEEEFLKMKQGSILINTARGGVIDTNALIKYLENGHLGGACLDVYENEKGLFLRDHRDSKIEDVIFLKLLELENVALTGHQAFLTEEALSGIARTTMDNLSQWQANGISTNDLF